MLSQTGSTTSSTLLRTRSTTSVKERRKHPLQAQNIDPQTARTHALIAAYRAVDRSRSSTSTNVFLSEDVPSTKSLSSSHGQSVTSSPATHLRRQRSTLQTRVPKLADTLQSHRPQSKVKQNQTHFDYESYFKIPPEHPGVEHSSYRKLRKSKSLLTPTRHIEYDYNRSPDTSLSQAPTLNTLNSSLHTQSPGFKLRFRRSLNFLRQPHKMSERVMTAPVQSQCSNLVNPEAIALARSQYFEGLAEQHLQEQPSASASSKAKRGHKTFRRTIRGTESPTKQTAVTVKQDSTTAKIDKRIMSGTLGSKIKKLFSRHRQDDHLPPQQLKASRAHFGEALSVTNSEAGFDSYLESEDLLSDRSRLYIPSNLHPETCDDVAQLSQHLSQSGSSESLSSASKSRVTSWTDSTATGSLAAQSAEPKRLSVIKEDGGPHQPSCSAGRHIGGVSVFQKPLQLPEGRVINSQRVYSALLKRIDEDQREMERTQAALKEIHDAKEQDDVVGHYLFSAPTIRRVESQMSVQPMSVAEDGKHGHRKPAIHINSSPLPDRAPETLQNLPTNSESSTSPSILSQVTENFEPKRRSPLRRFLHEKKSQSELGNNPENDSETDSVIVKSNHAERYCNNNDFVQSTESVYSRTTNGGTNPDYVSPILSTASLTRLEPPAARVVDVLNIARTSPIRTQCLFRDSRPEVSETASRRGPWQHWMDIQIESLGSRSNTRSKGHIREHAQIDPEDTDIDHHMAKSSGIQTGTLSATKGILNERMLRVPSIDSLVRSTLVAEPKLLPPAILPIKQVQQGRSQAHNQTTGIKRSKSALLDQTNKTSELVGLRKMSSTGVDMLLKTQKSQPVFVKSTNTAKENSPVIAADSPPLSTPGRYSVRMRSAHSTGRLRTGLSTSRLQQTYDRSRTNKEERLPQESPSNLSKSSFSARLSRPFDMDIPDRNRPFDSIYLGKRETGSASRLSVASNNRAVRQPKTYGNLGPAPLAVDKNPSVEDKDDSEETALPTLSDSTNFPRSVSGRSFGLVGKRMVSTFLRSRLKQANRTKLASSGSPAFI